MRFPYDWCFEVKLDDSTLMDFIRSWQQVDAYPDRPGPGSGEETILEVRALLAQFSLDCQHRALRPPDIYPDPGALTFDQAAFLAWFRQETSEGEVPRAVDSSPSWTIRTYVFLSAYASIYRFLETNDYGVLADDFDGLRRQNLRYADGTIDSELDRRLDRWQADAALLNALWDAAWTFRHVGLLNYGRRLDPDDILYVRSRCSETGLSSGDLRLLLLSDDGLTVWGKEHQAEVDMAIDVILQSRFDADGDNPIATIEARYGNRHLTPDECAEVAGACGWLTTPEIVARFAMTNDKYSAHWVRETSDSPIVDKQIRDSYVCPDIGCFQHVPNRRIADETGEYRYVDFPRFSFTRSSPLIKWFAEKLARSILREAENTARRAAGLPEIGSGWIGETELYQLVFDSFPETSVLRHARPSWLKPQHLDVYLPEYNVGLEYQGRQHFEPVEFFGGSEAFVGQLKRDKKKRRLCRRNGCTLIEVTADDSPGDIVARITGAIDHG